MEKGEAGHAWYLYLGYMDLFRGQLQGQGSNNLPWALCTSVQNCLIPLWTGSANCSQLRALADCSRSREVVVPECLRVMSTPLKPVSWRSELLNHPDQEFVKTLLQGITEGFRIGYDASKAHLRQKAAIMLSASEHREVVSLYLMEEL